jgi:Type VI secretion system/phage-baseplate injector OB domain
VADASEDDKPTMGSLGYREQFTWGSEQDPDPPVAKRHWGKYRGTVVENQDVPPNGRLLVSVPGIVITNWAMPCVPLAFPLMGMFARPAVGANVWVEFERGDPDKPIWTGGWWGEGEVPLPLLADEASALPLIQVITIESGTAGISICDTPLPAGGGTPGQVNIIADEGAVTIALSPGSVSITAPAVTITTGTFTVITPAGGFTVG